ncbi:hypothetical protein nACB1_077 [Acinetobacter phage nACB1]|nr:hypothetical protein nACB1_077 [Acinetobacter phage nACB1]
MVTKQVNDVDTRSKYFHIPSNLEWNKFIEVLLGLGYLCRSYSEEYVYNYCEHIRLDDGYFTLIPKEDMRHRPCVKVNENYLAQLKLLSHNPEVLKTWLKEL